MSDIYVELLTRIPVVAQKTAIGSGRLQEAQDATGLSNERLARKLHVATKTWERWKKAGEVPSYALANVAEVLGVEIKHAGPSEIEIEPTSPADLAAIRRELEETRAALVRIEEQLAEALPRRRRAPAS